VENVDKQADQENREHRVSKASGDRLGNLARRANVVLRAQWDRRVL